VEAESTSDKLDDVKFILNRIEKKITAASNEDRLVDVVLGAQWGDEGWNRPTLFSVSEITNH
jgi:hypothetical protein